MTHKPQHSHYVAFAIFAIFLLSAWFLYAPALSGTFLLDDQSNLSELQQVADRESALRFVASGAAGPVGRPIALASFLPHAGAWESGAREFLQFNVLLHLFNAGLLAYFLFRLSLARVADRQTASFVAVTAAAIWLLMPLLASSSLMVVQRMTTLSATFVFLTLIGYLHVRSGIERNPKRALTGMSLVLVVGTILAILVKENGALVPTLVLAMEITLLSRPRSIDRPKWRAWAVVFLMLPTALVVGYLATRLPYGEELVLRRDFTGWERLLTQSRILWEYLFNAFIPRPAEFGPFHDAHPVFRTILDPLTFAAIVSWLAVIAFALYARRRYPVAAFAVLWYLGGHILESTVLPLELYFEHRNYVPIVGPILALGILAARALTANRNAVYAGLSLYLLVNAFTLFGVASLWGQPAVAAHVWQQRSPDSVRAATHLASYEMAIHGHERALESVEEFVRLHPNDGYLTIQELKLRCIFYPDGNHRALVNELENSLRKADFDYSSATALTRLAIRLEGNECNGVDLETVASLARVLVRNPRYRQDVLYNQIHHQILALIAKQQGKYGEAIRHLEAAMEYRADAAINAKMVDTYVTAGRFSEARDFIEAARERAPVHPLKRYEWMSLLDDLSEFVTVVEQKSAQNIQPK